MKRILQPFYMLFALVTFTISLLITFPFFIIIGYKDSGKARSIIWLIVHNWAKGWMWFVGMGVKVSGHFPRGQKFVIVANHISYIDAINLYASIPDYFRTLAKKEMVRVPIFGFVYKQVAILVDRSSPESRAKSMRLMWRQIKRECCIAVFPEGTFNQTEETMKSFYDGAFRLAIQAQTPILPLLFPDTVHRWHFSGWWKLWPGKNRAIFLEPISVEGMTLENVVELRERVKEIMSEALRQL